MKSRLDIIKSISIDDIVIKPRKKVNKGCLWICKDWEEAIELSLKSSSCDIEPVYKDKYPNKLLDDTQEFIGYQMIGYGNRKKYKTRIPKRYNTFVEKLINEK